MVLVIDKSFRPIHFVRRKKALKMAFLAKGSFVMGEEVMQLKHVVSFRMPVKYSKMNLFLRDQHICQYCGKVCSSHNKTVDHILPVSRGGTSSFINCVTACRRCNSRKNDRTPTEAGMKLRKIPVEPTYDLLLVFSDESKIIDRFNQWIYTSCSPEQAVA